MIYIIFTLVVIQNNIKPDLLYSDKKVNFVIVS